MGGAGVELEEEANVGMARLRMGFLGHWNPAWAVGSNVDHPPTMEFPLDPSFERVERKREQHVTAAWRRPSGAIARGMTRASRTIFQV